jgi:exosortase
VAGGQTAWTIARRHLTFVALSILFLALESRHISRLLALTASDDRYSHIAVVPLITAGLLYLKQKRIFRDLHYMPKLGTALLAWAAALQLGLPSQLTPEPALAVSVLAVVLAWIAAFILCYGTRAFSAAHFPFIFLLLMIPLPANFIDRISYGLQVSSAELAHILFKLLGIPVFRDGFQFSLPGQIIRIAEQCSGIRSCIAFLITGLLLAYLFLRSGWRRLALTVVAVLISIFKNSLRIVILSSGERYFGVDLLHSSLHHQYGGVVFSMLALAVVIPVLLLLRRGERSIAPPKGA